MERGEMNNGGSAYQRAKEANEAYKDAGEWSWDKMVEDDKKRWEQAEVSPEVKEYLDEKPEVKEQVGEATVEAVNVDSGVEDQAMEAQREEEGRDVAAEMAEASAENPEVTPAEAENAFAEADAYMAATESDVAEAEAGVAEAEAQVAEAEAEVAEAEAGAEKEANPMLKEILEQLNEQKILINELRAEKEDLQAELAEARKGGVFNAIKNKIKSIYDDRKKFATFVKVSLLTLGMVRMLNMAGDMAAPAMEVKAQEAEKANEQTRVEVGADQTMTADDALEGMGVEVEPDPDDDGVNLADLDMEVDEQHDNHEVNIAGHDYEIENEKHEGKYSVKSDAYLQKEMIDDGNGNMKLGVQYSGPLYTGEYKGAESDAEGYTNWFNNVDDSPLNMAQVMAMRGALIDGDVNATVDALVAMDAEEFEKVGAENKAWLEENVKSLVAKGVNGSYVSQYAKDMGGQDNLDVNAYTDFDVEHAEEVHAERLLGEGGQDLLNDNEEIHKNLKEAMGIPDKMEGEFFVSIDCGQIVFVPAGAEPVVVATTPNVVPVPEAPTPEPAPAPTPETPTPEPSTPETPTSEVTPPPEPGTPEPVTPPTPTPEVTPPPETPTPEPDLPPGTTPPPDTPENPPEVPNDAKNAEAIIRNAGDVAKEELTDPLTEKPNYGDAGVDLNTGERLDDNSREPMMDTNVVNPPAEQTVRGTGNQETIANASTEAQQELTSAAGEAARAENAAGAAAQAETNAAAEAMASQAEAVSDNNEARDAEWFNQNFGNVYNQEAAPAETPSEGEAGGQ